MKKTLCISLVFLISSSFAFSQATEHICNNGEGGIVYYPAPITASEVKELKSYVVNGVITDINGTPLGGATIVSSDWKDIIANHNGTFSVKVNEKKPTFVRVEFVGYHSLKVVIDAEYNEKEIHVVLKEDTLKSRIKATKITPKKSMGGVMIGKPAIYLYPESEMKIVVKNNFKGEVLNTFPNYGDGWVIIASPNGKLLNTKDNRNYSYLFWDGFYEFPKSHFDYKDGFYVKKGAYVSFLLKKLTQVGLNETEINDFIVYWLPILNEYDESFIHFRINDDIGNSSKLLVTPKPETMIRLFMEFEEYDGVSKKLPEQKLPSITRDKFTLVEWGGGEVESNSVN